MPCNVFGTDEAIAALASDVEAQRARSPGFPVAFAVDDVEGPVLAVDPRQVLWSHDVLNAVREATRAWRSSWPRSGTTWTTTA